METLASVGTGGRGLPDIEAILLEEAYGEKNRKILSSCETSSNLRTFGAPSEMSRSEGAPCEHCNGWA